MKIENLILIALLCLMLTTSLVSAADESWITTSGFYQKVAEPYFVPSGMNGLSGVIVGIITTIIILVIFIDILSISTPFSNWVNWVISIGLGIIAILSKMNITVAGWIFSIGSKAFAWTGALAVGANIVIGILIIAAVFIPMNFFTNYLKQNRARAQALKAEETGIVRGGKLRGLNAIADAATK